MNLLATEITQSPPRIPALTAPPMNSLKLVVNRISPYSHPEYSESQESRLAPQVSADPDDSDDPPGPPPEPAQTGETGTMGRSVTSQVVMALLFFPNYLVVQPLLLLWALAKTGASFWRGSAVIVSDTPQKTPSPEAADPLVTRAEPSHARSTSVDYYSEAEPPAPSFDDQIKSPSATQKYTFPPPVRLFPLSRNPNRKKAKKKLILDLDETLIHSLSRGSPRSALGGGPAPKMIEICLNDVSSLYYVHKRPFCDYFLAEISQWFELQVFTASVQQYADPIIDWLERDIWAALGKKRTPGPVFTKRYYRNDCTFRKGVGYLKDLSRFFPPEELKNVVILDNSPVSYALHETNAVMIEGWINDQHDRDLLNLLPMLRSLSHSIDVRYILSLRGGEKVFE
ncbi:nuclear envelope morphology protein 1 [Diutina catenulata]